jgi:transposase InsO family protein
MRSMLMPRRNHHTDSLERLNRALGLAKGTPLQRARGTPPSAGIAANDLWCADFKGEFKLGNGHYCYPLTVTDHASRFLLLCEALDSTREDMTITAFEQLFRERGLPTAIRSDTYPAGGWLPFSRSGASAHDGRFAEGVRA